MNHIYCYTGWDLKINPNTERLNNYNKYNLVILFLDGDILAPFLLHNNILHTILRLCG